ncbi:putative colanic acid biosynthesis acetyltransferase WcaF [Winogradskyella eximia]|jgi:putative colanic acid biosynthesis acetyltransferase WcaF|uniref:Putative colanic acid biosynthesis acetyltransferase WcaF n=1 Tax=Winogradskyella eximia TaxID=262006 RepID=A0A3D9HA81_9FLAO|nr:putative colanic acid biosynthesis acetyltransferase [Winogradskyella eximia]RED46389.1 putative colanic acid biosynthesis acetyltransferase WcaF [Winogradskyella eximia]
MNNTQHLNKFKLPVNFRGKSKVTVQIWWIVQSIFFRMSPQVMYGWRRFLLRAFGAKIGKGVIIRPSTQITYPWKISIGDYSWIGDEVVLYSLGDIEIGSNTVISQRSYICTGSHYYDSENFDIYSQKITIGDKCWLATDVYVAPGITIGNFTVVGARSSVFKDLPSNKVCIGNPAKPFKDRS